MRDEQKNYEVTGRWTKTEHQKFLEALKLYGKNWKQIQEYVGTRSATQARSHAQKYFAKLQSVHAEGRTQETISVGSPVSKPEIAPGQSQACSNELSKISLPLKRTLHYLEDSSSKELESIFSEENYKPLEQETEEPHTLTDSEAHNKWLSEHQVELEQEYAPLLVYEPCLITSLELELPDFHLQFFSSSAHKEADNDETEYPEASLLRRYPSLSSVFE